MASFLTLFVTLLAASMPVFLVLGIWAGASFAASGRPLVGVAQLLINELNSPTLMALPLFVMTAAFMRFGGVANALVNLGRVARRTSRIPWARYGRRLHALRRNLRLECGDRPGHGDDPDPRHARAWLSAFIRTRRRRRLGNNRHRHSAELLADPVRHCLRTIGAAIVPCRHFAWPVTGRRVLPLGSVRGAPPQISS